MKGTRIAIAEPVATCFELMVAMVAAIATRILFCFEGCDWLRAVSAKLRPRVYVCVGGRVNKHP